MLRRSYWIVSSILLLLVLLRVLPMSARTHIVHLDIINGRHHVVEKFFGVTFKDEIVETPFSRLVAEHKLEGEAEWVPIIYNGKGLFGGFRMCAYSGYGHLGSEYREFSTLIYPHSSLENPTTAILEIRRQAGIGRGRGVRDVLNSITEQSDWPAK